MINPVNSKLVPVIACLVLVAMFVAYMIFLIYTWQQLQRDRSAAMAKVDGILDRMPRKAADVPAPDTAG